MKKIIIAVFSFEGRLNRQKFVLYNLCIFIALAIISSIHKNLNTITMLLILVLNYQSIRIFVLRLHDINRPGTHIFLQFIPFYNIWLLLTLLFDKGTDGENTYG